MNTIIVDGKELAKKIREEVKEEVAKLAERGIVPGLSVIIVGEDRASKTYVNSKKKASRQAGMNSEVIEFPATIKQNELIAKIDELNSREDVDGILVQMPLPKHLDEQAILDRIAPEKDVDGFHPVNVGRLTIGLDSLAPATPMGIMRILEENSIKIDGAHAVIIGRSDIVGKPMALMLLHKHATVTICHFRTKNLAEITRQADILVAAVGKTAMIKPEHIKTGAIIIDVGINDVSSREKIIELYGEDTDRLAELETKGYTLAGDVDPAVAKTAGLFTPVPGGVGPLTIAMLLKNCVKAAILRRK